MSAPIIIPGHIEQAKIAAKALGIAVGPSDEASKVLMLAAVAFNRTPQGSSAISLREQHRDTHHEISSLRNTVTQLREALKKESERIGVGTINGLRKHLKRIKKALENPSLTSEQKLVDITESTTYGLLVGTEEQAEIDKTKKS